MIRVDPYYVGFWSSAVMPQVLGGGVLVLGLLLPVDIFWLTRPRSRAVENGFGEGKDL